MLLLDRGVCLCLALLASGPLDIDKSPLRDGQVGASYADTLRLKSGESASWELREGQLPPGVSLVAGTGELTGTPTQSGAFEFEVRARVGRDKSNAKFTIRVNAHDVPPLPPETDISMDDVIEALLGVSSGLDAETRDMLDRQGNHNGVLDVGDLRAYLRLQGSLPH